MGLLFYSMSLLTTPNHTRAALCMVRMHLLSLPALCACRQMPLARHQGQFLKTICLCRGMQ